MKFSISILCHSALNLAKMCIESVRRHSIGHEYEMILTANGNEEAALYFGELRRAYWPVPVKVVVNERNEGFIRPNNHALTLAAGDYFICLNDDATVPPGWLERLEQPFLEDAGCAVSGPGGGCCSLSDQFIGFRGERFEYVEGSCLMVRRELALRHGLFSETLQFAYGEDADLCLRLREAGHTIHEANFTLHSHATGATTATVPGLPDIMRNNFAICRQRWAAYLKTRKFA